MEWQNTKTKSLNVLTAAPETQLGRGTVQGLMTRSGLSDAANAVVNLLQVRPGVSVAGKRKGEMDEISQI